MYTQNIGHSSTPSIIFTFKDSTYTTIQIAFTGHGKWKLSDDNKKILLTGLNKIVIDEVTEYNPAQYEFEILENGNLLVGQGGYYLRRSK